MMGALLENVYLFEILPWLDFNIKLLGETVSF